LPSTQLDKIAIGHLNRTGRMALSPVLRNHVVVESIGSSVLRSSSIESDAVSEGVQFFFGISR
jgi:hypothetical protein